MFHGLCIPSLFSPAQTTASVPPQQAGDTNAAQAESERLALWGRMKARTRRWRQAAWVVAPFLVGLAIWQPAQAGPVVWSVGVGVPGVVLQAGTPYPVGPGWVATPVSPRVVVMPPPPPRWVYGDEWGHRRRPHHHGHHHGHDDRYDPRYPPYGYQPGPGYPHGSGPYGAMPPAFGHR